MPDEDNNEIREHRIMVSFDEEWYRKLKNHSLDTGIPMAFTVHKAATQGIKLEKLLKE